MRWFYVAFLSVVVSGSPSAEIRQYSAPSPVDVQAEDVVPIAQTPMEASPTPAMPIGGIRINALQAASTGENSPSAPVMAPKDVKFKQEVDGLWNRIMNEYGGNPAARPGVRIFVSVNDFGPETGKQIDAVRNMAEMRKLNLPFDLYIEDLKGDENYGPVIQDGLSFLPDDSEMPIDKDNEQARALGVPPGQTTIIYRDARGAVRLYNLRNETDTLRRQLARELEAAQPPR